MVGFLKTTLKVKYPKEIAEYDASSLGRIRRMRGTTRPELNGNVLNYVSSIGLKGKSYAYDELIVATFLKYVDVANECIIHLDGDFKNCAIDNLKVVKLYDETKIWKDVVGWEGIYKISNYGDVVRCYRKQAYPNCRSVTIRGQFMKPRPDEDGYLRIGLTCHGRKSKLMAVHRLVAEAFIPNPENKPTVNHINGVKSDNRLVNLEWATYQEQSDHAIAHGLRTDETYVHAGQVTRERRSKKVRCLENGITYSSMIEAERQLGLWWGAVSENISKGKSAHGLHFERV